MHLIRLLLAGIDTLNRKAVTVRVSEHREALLAIKSGATAWDDVDRWRVQLHREFDQALAATGLPERPDYDRANQFLNRPAFADKAICEMIEQLRMRRPLSVDTKVIRRAYDARAK